MLNLRFYRDLNCATHFFYYLFLWREEGRFVLVPVHSVRYRDENSHIIHFPKGRIKILIRNFV